LLAGVVALARARQLSDGLWTAALACGFVLAMLYGVRPLLGRWMARVDVHAELAPSLLPGFFMLIIGSSAVTELIGIHALFGAFCLGAIMPKRSGLPRLLAAKLESVSVVLLLPLFFAYSGLRTQIGLLAGPEQWLVAGAIILVATLGKLGGGALAARAVGLCWREAGAIGILMNTRGLMELIVLNTGMDLGIISPTIFTMLVLMALVTTCATTPLLAWIYPARRLREESALEAAPLGAGLGAP
jgi:Kef-type K+ transport system membrane component KefB